MTFPFGGGIFSKDKKGSPYRKVLTELKSRVPDQACFYYNPQGYEDDWKELLEQAEEIMESPGSKSTTNIEDPRTREEKIHHIINGLVAEYGLARALNLKKNPKYLQSDLLLPMEDHKTVYTIEVKNIGIHKKIFSMDFGNNNKNLPDCSKFIRENKKVVDAVIVTSKDPQRAENGSYKIYVRKLIDGSTFIPWEKNRSGLIYHTPPKYTGQAPYYYAEDNAVERGQCIIMHPHHPPKHRGGGFEI